MLPVIDIMIDLYRQPRNFERFKSYLQLLQGNTKSDLVFPIGGFNPMAKANVIEKLHELKYLEAEKIIDETLKEINLKFCSISNEGIFKVVLNLSDDAEGGWTNRYTSDYDSKFKISPMVKRGFCTPLFWSGENYTVDLIRKRTMQYSLRTIHRLTNLSPVTLEDHVIQEKFVAENAGDIIIKYDPLDYERINQYYIQNKNNASYPLIFNFFYGDKASASLGFSAFGIVEEMTGFDYAHINKRE